MKNTRDLLATTKPARRSDETKARILDAARDTFAEFGYERATIRTIAERANIHPSMVMRYYTSKEGLFTASSQFDLHLPDLSKIDRNQLGEFIVKTFLDRWEKRRGAADMPALLRLSVTHPEGREKAIAIFSKQVRPMLSQIVRTGDSGTTMAMIATQLVGIAFLRYVLRLPAVVQLRDDDLVKHAGRTIQSYIDGVAR
jgi:AcrR family transcriptional regulator